jgi:hypothetical protein
MTTPNEVIEAFDECLDYMFGRKLGRDNPHASDAATARKWIADGVTLVLATMIFAEQMSWMHEKFLRFGDAKDRKYLPSSLKVFDENMATAIRRQRNGGQTNDWELSDGRWRCRVRGWQRKPNLWLHDFWGPAPFEPGCWVPGYILREFKKAA